MDRLTRRNPDNVQWKTRDGLPGSPVPLCQACRHNINGARSLRVLSAATQLG